MASRAWLVDLVKSIGEKTALCDHLEEKLLKDNPDPDIKSILNKTLNLRRQQMEILLDYAKKANPEWWCDFKHAIKSFTFDTEVLEVDPEKFEQMYQASADLMASVLSKFIGMEFEVCARCLFDKMLVEQVMEAVNE